jgi:hypothetical protein
LLARLADLIENVAQRVDGLRRCGVPRVEGIGDRDFDRVLAAQRLGFAVAAKPAHERGAERFVFGR